MDALGSQGSGADLGKAAGVVAAVIADGAGLAAAGFEEVLGKTTGGLADGQVVEAGGAHAHDAADTGGAEAGLASKGSLDGGVIVLHGQQLFEHRALAIGFPTVKFGSCIHSVTSPPIISIAARGSR